MSTIWLGAVVACTVFAAVNLSAAWCVWLVWPALGGRLPRMPPRSRAWVAFLSSVGPHVAGLVAATVAGAAFLTFEPPDTGESAGVSLLVAAAAGAAMLGAAGVRAGMAVHRSRALLRAWTGFAPCVVLPGCGVRGWCIDAPFPVVAVTGVWRPRLVVARSVLERCTPGELSAVVAHEQAHVAARDNLKRLCMHAVRDVFGRTMRGADADRAWQEASEEAADRRAIDTGAGRLDLASAVVTIARLGAGTSPCPLPAGSSFYRGGSIERRVKRLLDGEQRPAGVACDRPWPPPHSHRATSPALAALGVAAGAAAVWLFVASPAFRAVYDAAEWLVQSLP